MSGLSGVILAGTYRWNDASLEALAARPLLPVALSPLVSYSLRWLHKGGVRRATVCANHNARALEAALGSGAELGMELSYYQDHTPRGAAGCVRDAGVPTDSETLVVADGTVIPTVDLSELLAAHRASEAAVTVVVHRDPLGIAPPSAGGVYVFDRRALDLVPRAGFQDIKENLIPKLHRAGERVVAHETEGCCPRVLNAQTYLAVNQWVLEGLAHGGNGNGIDGLSDPSAWVEPGARLLGPVQLGPRVHVQAGATIVGPTSIGADSTVGRNALVGRSVLWSRCQVGEGSLLQGCVLGNDATVPAISQLFHAVRPHEAPQSAPFLLPLMGRSKPATPAQAWPGPALSHITSLIADVAERQS